MAQVVILNDMLVWLKKVSLNLIAVCDNTQAVGSPHAFYLFIWWYETKNSANKQIGHRHRKKSRAVLVRNSVYVGCTILSSCGD